MNLNVGIFHAPDLGRELGKRGAESDILMFSRKTDDHVFTFLVPRDDKTPVKAEIMSQIDAAIVSFAQVTPEVGETIVMLDALSIRNGVAIIPPETILNDITALTRGTALESYHVRDGQPQGILEALEKMPSERESAVPTDVVIDSSFSVKGVGEVILGFVRRGIVHKHDKLRLLPLDKEIIVRSIQMQDKDFAEAGAGSRVGLCIKGATVEEMRRGYVLCQGDVSCGRKITLNFKPNTYYKPGIREGNFHVSVGMQTVPVKVSLPEGRVVIESEKPIVYTPDEIFLLLDINAEKMHLMGTGKAA